MNSIQRQVTYTELATNKLRQPPYQKCIEIFRKITTVQSPYEKISVIGKVCEQIQLAISNFWEGLPVNSSKLALTIDELLSIFLYIIVKARIKDLEAHLFLIYNFCDEYTLYQSKEGQVFLTVQQSV